MLEIKILGCGSSLGVPVIGCGCSICQSPSPFNKRMRSSIYVTKGNTNLLIDFGFDIKQQLLREKISKLDAAILTHDHADHVGGIDDLRIFSFLQKRPLNIITDHNTANIIEKRYKYLFEPKYLQMQPVDFYQKYNLGEIEIQFFCQDHNVMESLGVRIGNFVYSNDLIRFPETSKQYLQNIDTWILDCISYQASNVHAGLEQVLQWNDEFKPKQIWLTDMNHHIDYFEIIRKLPSNIKPLYDGCTLIISE